jgi:hypothetical protein
MKCSRQYPYRFSQIWDCSGAERQLGREHDHLLVDAEREARRRAQLVFFRVRVPCPQDRHHGGAIDRCRSAAGRILVYHAIAGALLAGMADQPN